MKLDTGIRLHNRFDAVLVDAATGEVKQVCKAENLVTNAFYNTLIHDSSRGNWSYPRDIVIGTGAGTPQASDTALFNQIYSGSWTSVDDQVHRLSDTEFYYQVTVTCTENQANGNLTEIGLSGYLDYYVESYLFSHAMFTDSEGQPIIIEKTNTDRLIVTATIYVKLTYPAGMIPPPFSSAWLSYQAGAKNPADSLSRYPEIHNAFIWGIPPLFYNLFFNSNSRARLFEDSYSESQGLKVPRLSLARQTVSVDTVCLSGSSTTAVTSPSCIYRYTANRVLSTAMNVSGITYQIFGITTPLGYIPFPNHTKFPPLNLELSKVASANQQDFNFGIPELMSDVTVYVNDVEQPSTAYVWNGKDFTLKQAWANAHGDKLVKHSTITYYSTWTSGNCPLAGFYMSYTYASDLTYMIYDFESPKAVDTLKSQVPCILSKSDDGETWTQVAQKTGSSLETITFTETSARYWKIENASGLYVNVGSFAGSMTQFIANFDKVTPQLHFNTPLNADDVVKIQCKSEYPIKNENWLIDQFVLDWTLAKDES